MLIENTVFIAHTSIYYLEHEVFLISYQFYLEKRQTVWVKSSKEDFVKKFGDYVKMDYGYPSMYLIYRETSNTRLFLLLETFKGGLY